MFFYFIECEKQCCGSVSESGSVSTGSTCFWASWIRIRIHQSEVWIRLWVRIWILQSPSKKNKKNLDSYCFATSFWIYIFENDAHVYSVPSKCNKQKNFLKNYFFVGILGRSMTKIAGSGSASGLISQRHGSADPDPPQNVMDPQHWEKDNLGCKDSVVWDWELHMILFSFLKLPCP